MFNDAPPLNTPVIIKPTFESASRGITDGSVVHYTPESDDIIRQLQKQFEQNILVQQFIEGYEVQVPVIKIHRKAQPLLPVGISMNQNPLLGEKIITYDIAYDETYDFYDFKKINAELAEQLSNTACQACELLGLEHYCRFDFRIDQENNYYITDISTHPFLIQHSAFAFAFSSLGYSYEDIFLLLIGLIADNGEKTYEYTDCRGNT